MKESRRQWVHCDERINIERLRLVVRVDFPLRFTTFRFRSPLLIVLLILIILSTGPYASAYSRVGALTLNPGENNLFSAGVIDSAHGFAYFGTEDSPAKIVKIRLSDFTRVGALTLNPGENILFPAVIDPTAGYAYFGTDTSPAIIVKVQIDTTARVGCGAGSCTVASNATVSSPSYDPGTGTVHLIVSGTTGSQGYANVTIPKSAVLNQDSSNIKVTVNQMPLPSSALAIRLNSTYFFVYFTFTFHSNVRVDISLGIIGVDLPSGLALATLLSTAPVLFQIRRPRPMRQ